MLDVKQSVFSIIAAGTAALLLPLSAAVVRAQTAPAGQGSSAKPAVKAAPAQGAPDGALKARVESLEEQLVDMQVVVGTLESLAKSGGNQAQPAFRSSAPAGGDPARVDALESQVKALSAQVQQLSDQLRSQGGVVQRRSDAPLPAQPGLRGSAGGNQFGSTTVTEGDAIGGLLSTEPGAALPPGTLDQQAARSGGSGAAPPAGPSSYATAALPPPSDGINPKQLYETAYGYLLQRDYGAAEAAFDDFLKKYPSDGLSGNAQYWLGESFFVRGQYKSAAGAFLKGYQSYGQSAKAPDSLLKLAMSLDRLGQKDAACSSFLELNVKFPNAPQNVKSRAQSERQRIGCS